MDDFEYLLEHIERVKESFNVKGTDFSHNDINKYNEIILLCLALFKDKKGVRFKIKPSLPELPFVNICVKIRSGFEVNALNKKQFIKLISLSDSVSITPFEPFEDCSGFDLDFFVSPKILSENI